MTATDHAFAQTRVPEAMPDTGGRDPVATVLIASSVATGLIAGTYYAFACSVMPGLAKTDDATFIDVMQRINKVIENPVFFASFFGAFVLPAISVWQQRKLGRGPALRWTIAGLALYTAGLLTTMGINVPLNNTLAHAGDAHHIANAAKVRSDFEGTWNTWNIFRAVTSTAAIACLGRALQLHRRSR
jgi:uncharacterized membrane protein